MKMRSFWIEFQRLSVFNQCLRIVVLRFQRFARELVNTEGLWMLLQQIVYGSFRQSRVEFRNMVQDIGIIGVRRLELTSNVKRVISIRIGGTAEQRQSDHPPELRVELQVEVFLQKRQ